MILLDTHVVVWLAQDPDLLPGSIRRAIAKERQVDGLAISCHTLWELALLISRGRISVVGSLKGFLDAVEKRFTVLPITGAIAERATQFSDRYPRDSADRLIGATATEHNMVLLTSDKAIVASGEVRCIG